MDEDLVDYESKILDTPKDIKDEIEYRESRIRELTAFLESRGKPHFPHGPKLIKSHKANLDYLKMMKLLIK